MNKKRIPRISIVLPVCNGLGFLETSLSSVLKQSYSNFELLIIDDASTDDSLTYLRSLKDERIRLFSNNENKGLFFNLNFLIKNSNAPLIKLWSQDDIMNDYCIERIIEFHERNPQIGFSYSGRDIINEHGEIISTDFIDATPEIVDRPLHSKIAFFTGSIAGNISNVTIPKDVLEKTGKFDESMKISGDFDMWVRIAENFPVGYIKDHLIQLREHKGQLSRQKKFYINHLKEDFKVYEYLLNYLNDRERSEGKTILRSHKLLFYYTLMVRAFFKGSMKTGFDFLRTLHKFDNFWILSFYFIKNRIIFRKRFAGIHLDNSEFIITEPR
jgi:glycosyltransferase involved in cell wall biosynthesis